MSFLFPLSDVSLGMPFPAPTQHRVPKLATSLDFFDRCDHETQALLFRCRWHLGAKGDRPILSITCPTTFLYGRVLASLEGIGRSLSHLSDGAKIRIYRPLSFGIPFELSIDELLTP